MKAELVDIVAAAIHEAIYRNASFDKAHPEAKMQARADARTVLAAWLCRQGPLDAAKRLATWHWVDHKRDHVPWDQAPEQVQRVMQRKADAGFEALRGKPRSDAQ